MKFKFLNIPYNNFAILALSFQLHLLYIIFPGLGLDFLASDRKLKSGMKCKKMIFPLPIWKVCFSNDPNPSSFRITILLSSPCSFHIIGQDGSRLWYFDSQLSSVVSTETFPSALGVHLTLALRKRIYNIPYLWNFWCASPSVREFFEGLDNCLALKFWFGFLFFIL